MSEALAIDVVRDPASDLGARLDRFAGAHGDRFGRFGVIAPPGAPSMLSRLEGRWAMGLATTGLIEVFDGADFGPLVREWGLRAGYDDGQAPDHPFVIPVDPVDPLAAVGGPRAATRRPARQ
ncbi:hypothetical protein KDM41_16550, partial [bacterium]|nr:hypothetical protein [bacterium]